MINLLLQKMQGVKSLKEYFTFKENFKMVSILEEIWQLPHQDKMLFFNELIRLMNVLNAFNAQNEVIYIFSSVLDILESKKGYAYYSKVGLIYIQMLIDYRILNNANRIINFLLLHAEEIGNREETIKAYYFKLLLHIEYAKLKTMSKKINNQLSYQTNWLKLDYEYNIYNIEIFSAHIKDLELSKEEEENVFNQLKGVILHFRLKNFTSANKRIEKLSTFIANHEQKNTVDFNLLIAILKIEAAVQASDFLELNKLITDIVEYFDKNNFLKDAISFLIFWAFQFSENGYMDDGKTALLQIKSFSTDCAPKLYAKLIYRLFRISIQESDDVYKIYMHQLIDNYEDYLEFSEKHFLRLIAAEDSSLNVNSFNEAMGNFKKSNQYLMKNWNNVISNINVSLHDIQDIEPMLINKAIEFNFKEILLDSNLHINHFLQSLENVFENLRKVYQNVQDLSLTDELTGLNNRRYLKSNTPEMFFLAARQGRPMGVAMFDLDDFKHLNDTYGHPVGDQVLVEFANILKQSFRQSDIIIRYGGEEFLAVLFDANVIESKNILEKARKKFEAKTFYSDNAEEFHATVSIGLCSDYVYSNKTEDILDTFISNADIALYQSKTNGKNRVSIYLQ